MGPEPRDSHACCKCKNKMYLFGGNSGDSALNDFW